MQQNKHETRDDRKSSTRRRLCSKSRFAASALVDEEGPMNPTKSMDGSGDTCRRCGHPGSDLRLLGCGCTLHVKCTPLSLIVADKSQAAESFGAIPNPAPPNSRPCPICHGIVSSIHLFPVSFLDLDTAIDLRKRQVKSVADQEGGSGSKRPREDDIMMEQIHGESSYFLLSHTSGGHGHGDHQCHRTGRWAAEEIAFVDHLVQGFDQGLLALPHGVKLNEFLGDMLVCKSSRLTKKMKNAKLSTRSYTIRNTQPALSGINEYCETLSVLQQRFLQSLSSRATQLELRFNMNKLWRTHFSNLCLQVGYNGLDARDWLTSLEEMENRASNAEDMIRKARRRRMGLALRKDVGQAANPGVFIGDMEAKGASALLGDVSESGFSIPAPATVSSSSINQENGEYNASSQFNDSSQFSEEMESLNNFLEMGDADEPNSKRSRLFSVDIGLSLDDLADPLNLMTDIMSNSSPAKDACGPFLQSVASFLKTANLPFEHVDAWVPSYVSSGQETSSVGAGSEGEGKKELRLFHAGHATKSGVDPVLAGQLEEYGHYSTNFSFKPGAGLPGRVYVSGQPHWENSIHEADPHIFERAGGAKVYGVKAALGLAIDSPDVGRVVVAMYSTLDVAKDPFVIQQCLGAISQLTPSPKWKLVIETGVTDRVPPGSAPSETAKQAVSSNSDALVRTVRSASVGEASHASAPAAAIPSPVTSLRPIKTTMSGAMLCHDHTKPPIVPEPPRGNGAATPSAQALEPQPVVSPRSDNNSSSAPQESDNDLENQIASLLGLHMPLTASSTSDCSPDLVRHFMSLRLLLLRPSERRSKEESEMVGIIKNSFCGYSKDNGRSGSELASLIAKDWMYLTAGMTPDSSPSIAPQPPLKSPSTASPPLVSSSLTTPANPQHPGLTHPVSFSAFESVDQGPNHIMQRSRTVSASTESLSPHQNKATIVAPEN